MTDWLTFTLAAPMASFGEAPGNASRATADRPSKSALTGLIGAALGVVRKDAAGQEALTAGYRFVTRTDQAGAPLRDFHTYQSLPSAKGRPMTRAEALAHPEIVTSITRRDYRCDVLWRVAMQATEAAPFALEAVAAALCRPRFLLYLGRKSCPLSRPLDPKITDAASGRAAIDARFAPVAGAVLAAEDEADLGPGGAVRWRERRRDLPLDRLRWTFAARDAFLEAGR